MSGVKFPEQMSPLLLGAENALGLILWPQKKGPPSQWCTDESNRRKAAPS